MKVVPASQETEDQPLIVDVDDVVLIKNDASNKGLLLELTGGSLSDSRSTQKRRQPLPVDIDTQFSTSTANGRTVGVYHKAT